MMDRKKAGVPCEYNQTFCGPDDVQKWHWVNCRGKNWRACLSDFFFNKLCFKIQNNSSSFHRHAFKPQVTSIKLIIFMFIKRGTCLIVYVPMSTMKLNYLLLFVSLVSIVATKWKIRTLFATEKNNQRLAF